jgi:hypothetical protein
MAASTVSNWTESRVGYNGTLYIATCTILQAVANTATMTKKTPLGLNVRRPWTLIVAGSAAADAGQTPVLELWGGHSDSFVNDNSASLAATAATDGAKLLDLCDDIVLCVTARPFFFHMIPIVGSAQQVANVVTVAAIATGFKVGIPVLPYYAFGIQGDTTLDAVTVTYKIIQG